IPGPIEPAGCEGQVESLAVQLLRVGESAVDIEYECVAAHHRLTNCTPRASCSLRHSISRQIMGVKINCIARSILPPGQTMVLARDMNESCSIESKYGKSMPRGLEKWITRKDSSGVGMNRAMNGFEVSTTGTRWKLM